MDDLFDMGGGYVLDFTNATFREFFRDDVGVDIYDDRYAADGESKAKRLRFFLKSSNPQLVARALLALWAYRTRIHELSDNAPPPAPAKDRQFAELIQRLGAQPPPSAPATEPAHAAATSWRPDPAASEQLKSELLRLAALDPQARGYAFERFLGQMFDLNRLKARASFRLVGEQIDGSFELDSEVYLLEAKWTAPAVGVAHLRAFNAKVQDKASWSRGLFVSESGFTPDGLQAFGNAKRVVCMNGLDIYEMLNRGLSFSEVMRQKVRRAAETGSPFVPVGTLFG